MGQMVGSFHRLNNKEHRCLILEPRVGWAFEDWLTGYMAFLVIQSILSCPQLGLMMRRPRRERLLLGAGQSCQLPPKQDCCEGHMVDGLDVETDLCDSTCVSGEARVTCPCCCLEFGVGGDAAASLEGQHTEC